MIRWKPIVPLLLLCLTWLLVNSCGGEIVVQPENQGSEETGETEGQPAETPALETQDDMRTPLEGTVGVFAYVDDGFDRNVLDEVVREFEANNPGVTVELETRGP